MKRLAVLIGLLILLLTATVVFTSCGGRTASVPWPSPPELSAVARQVQPVAEEALLEYHSLVDLKDFKDLGFDSVAEARSATLGEPLVVYRMTLRTLQAFQTNTPATQVLKPAAKVIYPVMTRDKVRSSITLQNARGPWEASDFGYAELTRILTETRQQVAARFRLPASQVFVVEMVALNRMFVGYGSADGPMLTPVASEPALNFVAGQPLAAGEVMARLAPLARENQGFPPRSGPPEPRPPAVRPAPTNTPLSGRTQ